LSEPSCVGERNGFGELEGSAETAKTDLQDQLMFFFTDFYPIFRAHASRLNKEP